MNAEFRGFAPVSVVVPCWRCTDSIAATVRSVAAQTLRPAEVLLVDDASGDGTVEALQRLQASHLPGWIRVLPLQRNGGPARARNIGWEHARQPWVAFLDADDTWARDKLALQMRALDADAGIDFIAHRMRVAPRDAEYPQAVRPPRVRRIGPRRMMLNNPFPTSSVVLRRELPFRFDERYRRVEDFLLWAQIVLSGHRCARLERVLASWHKPNYGAGGLSADLAAMHAAGREVRRELLRQGLVSLPVHYATCAIGEVRKARQRLLLALRQRRAAWEGPSRGGEMR
jgi:glycosyltransferase involved in cell wall biosynthesis